MRSRGSSRPRAQRDACSHRKIFCEDQNAFQQWRPDCAIVWTDLLPLRLRSDIPCPPATITRHMPSEFRSLITANAGQDATSGFIHNRPRRHTRQAQSELHSMCGGLPDPSIDMAIRYCHGKLMGPLGSFPEQRVGRCECESRTSDPSNTFSQTEIWIHRKKTCM